MRKKTSLREKAIAAMEEAVAGVIEEHRKSGQPLAVWRDGKVVLIPPSEAASVRESPVRYDRKRKR
ncbi:MAG: hypothetical protein AB1696_27805 [Planctomycetota bacterium]